MLPALISIFYETQSNIYVVPTPVCLSLVTSYRRDYISLPNPSPFTHSLLSYLQRVLGNESQEKKTKPKPRTKPKKETETKERRGGK